MIAALAACSAVLFVQLFIACFRCESARIDTNVARAVMETERIEHAKTRALNRDLREELLRARYDLDGAAMIAAAATSQLANALPDLNRAESLQASDPDAPAPIYDAMAGAA